MTHYNGLGDVQKRVKLMMLLMWIVLIIGVIAFVVGCFIIACKHSYQSGYEQGKKDFAPTSEAPWPAAPSKDGG